MKSFKISLILSICVVFCAMTNAIAFPIALEVDASGNNFDINSTVTNVLSQNNYTLPYVIVSAYAEFNLSDDGDLSLTQTTYGNYIRAAYKDYRRTVVRYYTDASESGDISMVHDGIDLQSTSFATESYSIPQTYIDRTFQETYNFPRIGTVYRYNNNYEVVSGYGGSVSETIVFDVNTLNDLSEDGIVEFAVNMTDGDINFDSATLFFEIEENPAAPVPEPTTMLLLGIGILTSISRRKLF